MMEKQLKGELMKMSKVLEKRQEELLQKQNVVGLLFAGSTQITIHNNIFFVAALLGIRII